TAPSSWYASSFFSFVSQALQLCCASGLKRGQGGLELFGYLEVIERPSFRASSLHYFWSVELLEEGFQECCCVCHVPTLVVRWDTISRRADIVDNRGLSSAIHSTRFWARENSRHNIIQKALRPVLNRSSSGTAS